MTRNAGKPWPMRCFVHGGKALWWAIPCLLCLYAAGLSSHTAGAGLFPTPDAVEYGLLAQRLARLQAPLLEIGLHEYPSRYSLTYPLLLAPVARLTHLDLTKLWWGSFLFGLIAVGMMARVGGWLLGSRAAGGLAACFFALHPQTSILANQVMSETALVMMFFLMLEAARPWLQGSPRAGGVVRACILGLLAGWLTLSKAPFAFWVAGLAILMFARAKGRRDWQALAAFVVTVGLCGAADAVWRRWAFGAWGVNGYHYWFPPIYDEPLRIFHWKYLWTPFESSAGVGNLAYYGRVLLGRTHDFYSVYMACSAMVAAACLAWPWRRGHPTRAAALLLVGWFAAGLAFCGLYFYQGVRFLLLWIPVVDLIVAWGLVQVPAWHWLAKGWRRRLSLKTWARVAALAVMVILLRGELLRVRGWLHVSPERGRKARTETIQTMLKRVPKKAWLFTNYHVPLVNALRPHRGPTGGLYHYVLDEGYLNPNMWGVRSFALQPRRVHAGPVPGFGELPAAWRDRPANLIDAEGRWELSEEDLNALDRQPVYLLVIEPPEFPSTGAYLEQTIIPLLKSRWDLKKKESAGPIELYRVEPLAIQPAAQ